MPGSAPRRLRLLAITNEFPLPLDRGGPVRILGLARALATAHDLHVLALRRPNTTDTRVGELSHMLGGPVETFDPPAGSGGWPRALFRGVPPWIAAQHSPELERRARELVEAVDAVVILDDYAAIYAPGLAAGAPVVCDKHNVLGWTAGEAQPAPGIAGTVHRRLSISLTRRFEQKYVAPAAGLVVTSQDEADRMRSLYDLGTDAVVPSAVDVPASPVELAGTGAIGWLGTHEYEANVQGLVRFVEEGWQPLGEAGRRLLVIGGNPPPHVMDLERHPGVEILGFVESLPDVFAQLSAAVVPLWRGAGVKLKTLTFMAYGVPVAGTSMALEGIDCEPGRDCLLAEEPDELAAAAGELVDDQDTARRMGAAGRRLVGEQYSWPAVGGRFREEVERVAAQ